MSLGLPSTINSSGSKTTIRCRRSSSRRVSVQTLKLVHDLGRGDCHICWGNSECWSLEETKLLETIYGGCVESGVIAGWISSGSDNFVVTGILVLRRASSNEWDERVIDCVELSLRDDKIFTVRSIHFCTHAHTPSIYAKSIQDWVEGRKVPLILSRGCRCSLCYNNSVWVQ